MMDETMKMVAEFHRAFEIDSAERPISLATSMPARQELSDFAKSLETLAQEAAWAAAHHKGDAMLLLRVHLMIEELGECVRGLARGDMVEVLDALCDMRYVADGTALSLGLADVFSEAFEEVHRSNMSKLVDGKPLKSTAGRVVKGTDYTPPALREILER